MAGVAHGQIEHDAEQFAFVVVRDAAFGPAVVCVAFEPSIEAGVFRRLRQMRRAPFEFANLRRAGSRY